MLLMCGASTIAAVARHVSGSKEPSLTAIAVPCVSACVNVVMLSGSCRCCTAHFSFSGSWLIMDWMVVGGDCVVCCGMCIWFCGSMLISVMVLLVWCFCVEIGMASAGRLNFKVLVLWNDLFWGLPVELVWYVFQSLPRMPSRW